MKRMSRSFQARRARQLLNRLTRRHWIHTIICDCDQNKRYNRLNWIARQGKSITLNVWRKFFLVFFSISRAVFCRKILNTTIFFRENKIETHACVAKIIFVQHETNLILMRKYWSTFWNVSRALVSNGSPSVVHTTLLLFDVAIQRDTIEPSWDLK